MSKRIEQLDSIRGLAALSVFFCHIANLFTAALAVKLFQDSPLKIFVHGHGAVLLFFMMSGLVLTIPYLRGTAPGYRNFMIKRILRIYVPYLVAIATAMAAFWTLAPVYGFGDWIAELSTGKTSVKSIAEHVLLIGNYDTTRYDTVIWSLVHEMRISLIFPLLALLIVRAHWTVNLAVCAVLSLAAALNNLLHWEPVYGYQNSYSYTLHYISMFIVGGLIAKHLEDLVRVYRRLPVSVKYGALLIAMAIYVYSVKFQHAAARFGAAFLGETAEDYAIAVAAAIVLTIALGSGKAAKWLSLTLVRFFGDISYSLYLWHIVVLIGFLHLLQHSAPLAVILPLVFAVTVAVSWLSYRYIELPAIKLGRKWTARQPSNAQTAPSIQPELTA